MAEREAGGPERDPRTDAEAAPAEQPRLQQDEEEAGRHEEHDEQEHHLRTSAVDRVARRARDARDGGRLRVGLQLRERVSCLALAVRNVRGGGESHCFASSRQYSQGARLGGRPRSARRDRCCSYCVG